MLFAVSSVPYFSSIPATSRQRTATASLPSASRCRCRGREEWRAALTLRDARELQLEPYALFVALATKLVHLSAQLLGGIGGLALELGGPDAALVELHLVVLARLCSRVTSAQPALLVPIYLCAAWFCLPSYGPACFDRSSAGFVSSCMTSFNPPFHSDRQRSSRLVAGGRIWMRRKAVGWQEMVTSEQNGRGAIRARKTNLRRHGL